MNLNNAHLHAIRSSSPILFFLAASNSYPVAKSKHPCKVTLSSSAEAEACRGTRAGRLGQASPATLGG
jgi:hypothetical protein